MRKNVLRIFSGLLAVLMFSAAIVPASAVGTSASRSDFFTWTNGFGGGKYGGGASRGDSESAYDAYVQELPATGYNSSGKLIWQPTKADLDPEKFFFGFSSLGRKHLDDIPFDYNGYESLCFGEDFNGFVLDWYGYGSSLFSPSVFGIISYKVPISGSYFLLPTLEFEGYIITSSGERVEIRTYYSEQASHCNPGITFDFSYRDTYLCKEKTQGIYAYANLYFPCYEIIPDTAPSADTYNTTTRPTSITGGNYGIVGDNGQITRVEDNSTIINEINNTYYNPATGQTQPITAWSYDYSDRSYKLTLDGGNTSTVTYGDENISITETTVNESGDTITNNYTIYYLIDGSGETPVDPPAVCEHDWQEASSTDPTCTMPGKVTLTCTKCQQTKTETIPALGHDWQLKQTVTTQYDDTGQLVQQGYTIFECSRCHEQYKSADGTIPPGGGSGTDPGGDEGETIWDKLGNLIGAIGSGAIELIDAALGKLLDALIALAGMLVEKLKTVVETVLSIFDELPLLFGGFLDFLVAVFPFLPPELMTILTFGVIAVVFIAIIKAVRR